MGQGYTKIGGRRRGSGGLQWILIGFLPGLLCGVLIFFLLLMTGTLTGFAPESTPIYITEVVEIQSIITTTPEPTQVMVITATPEPTTELGESQISLPTATEAVTQEAEMTETVAVSEENTSIPDTTAQNSDAQAAAIPAQLAQIVSPMVTIPGGTFTMGTDNTEIINAVALCSSQGGQCLEGDAEDSKPTVSVAIDTFRMEQYEVSFEQYLGFLNWLNSQGQRHTSACSGFICIQTANENPEGAVITFDSANYNAPPGLLSHPVYGVTWYGAEAYCRAIGRRLPTEAEWEYAARSGDGRIYPWGNTWSDANANTRLPLDGPQGTLPVNEYAIAQNPFGLYNMSGNVAEWVSDWYDPTFYTTLFNQAQGADGVVSNPERTALATQKVLRGGSWNTFPFFARVVHRQALIPAPDRPNDPNWVRWTGFRCAGEVEADAAVSNGSVNPATLGVVVPNTSSEDASTNAQPTLATAPESTDTTEGGSRG